MSTQTTKQTIDLNAPITSLPRVGEGVAKKLERLGIRTVRDLLTHWPRRWDDYSQLTPLDRLVRDQTVVVRGTLHGVTLERRKGKRLVRVTATLRDSGGSELPVVWFNQAYLARSLVERKEYTLAGQVKWDWHQRHLYLNSPRRDVSLGIVPVYPETEGITSRFLSSLVTPLLPSLELPDPVAPNNTLLELTQALRVVHQPATLQEAMQARTRLEFDEHLLLQLGLARQRAKLQSYHAPSIQPSVEALRGLVATLPFQPTDGQRAAAWKIIQHLNSASPTRHLLQGDVGSGKTLVAALVSLSVLESGYHVIWLAPTQVLASQLADRLGVLLKHQSHAVQLVVAGTETHEPEQATLFVGTHALLGRSLDKVGFVIVDEQQRFGVDQREELLAPNQGKLPHSLMMTATPIPRSLALAILGQDELVTLTDRPHHQQPVTTIRGQHRSESYRYIEQALVAGQQVFVVVPRIDGVKETLFVQNIDEVSASYQAQFPKARIVTLHGRLGNDEQQHAIEQFLSHKADILVATTMVEVGIDAPNATVMVIEEADRFGLAQLHQLRGRVGRGKAPGTCIVCTMADDELVSERLEAFVKSRDGFELARLDLQLRGPGELLGTIQSGLPELRLASLDDTLLIERARSLATQWAQRAPEVLPVWLAFHGQGGRGNELVGVDPDKPSPAEF